MIFGCSTLWFNNYFRRSAGGRGSDSHKARSCAEALSITDAAIPAIHIEAHRAHRIGWIRAAVLGANDSVASVSGLIVGVAAGGASQSRILLTGVAGLVAGALSMAAGECISVQSQADTENAALRIERRELAAESQRELDELKEINMKRGLGEQLSQQVAAKLMAGDALAVHARDLALPNN